MISPAIDPRQIGWILGQFLLILGGAMLLPVLYALVSGGEGLAPCVEALAVTLGAALLLLGLCRGREDREIKQREGIVLVVLVWFAVCAFGALPFQFSPYFSGFTDAFFESASGFTTTGASVLGVLEQIPRPLLLWRCFSHWFGGMGIVLLGVAILPLVGQGGMQLYRAEFSGAKSQRLKPRVVETAKALFGIYVAFTLTLTAALALAGMDLFEAACHAFSTMGTGGFSTRSASIAAYDSPLIEYLIILFMVLAGASFVQHYHLLVERRPGLVFRDTELLSYLGLIGGVSLVIALVLILQQDMAWEPALRGALFQVASIITTTGFVSADFELWPPLPQFLLFLLMAIGGCTASTAGGLKVARLALLDRVIRREMNRVAEPQGVFTIRMGEQTIPEQTINGLLNLLYLSWIVVLCATLLLTATGLDILSALTAVVTCTSNVGPGLGVVGPMDNYSGLPAFAKWVLALVMITGRLEFYTLLVIFTSAFWRR